eukprot:g1465.t1
MPSPTLSKEEKLDVANKAREEVKQLLSVAKEGSVNGVRKFVEEYVAKHSKSDQPLTEAEVLGSIRDGNGRTALHFAATGGSAAVVGEIFDMAPSVIDSKDDHGLTPLALALITGSHEAAARLASLGADVSAADTQGVAPAHRAAGHGDLSALELLKGSGADFETQSGAGTPLHWAAGEGEPESVRKLLSLGANPDPRNKQGLTPLIMAAARGCGPAVVHLVEAGADPGLVLSGGATVLHMSADMGLGEAVEAILATEVGRKSAALKDTQGRLPAHLAAMSSRRDLVELLLPHSGLGPDVGLDAVMARGKELAEEHEGELRAQEALKKPSGPTPAQGLGEEGNTSPPKTLEHREAAVAAKTRGNELLKAKDLTGALAAYTEAIELDGSDAAFRSNRSAVYMSMKEYEKALVDAEVCRRLKPDWQKACYRMAVARLALGRFEDAALAAWEGVQLDNDNAQLKSLLQKCSTPTSTTARVASVSRSAGARLDALSMKLGEDEKVVLIGVAADSGCGKSTFMRRLTSIFGGDTVGPLGGGFENGGWETNSLVSDLTTVLCLDDYHLNDRGGRKVSGKTALHTDEQKFDLMFEQLNDLKNGKSVMKPIYNHVNGTLDEPEEIKPTPIVIIEGLHPFVDERVRDLLDFTIYLDISDEIKFAWKIQRDMMERGHSLESIQASIEARKPDFDAFIAPQRSEADVVIQVLPTQLIPGDTEGKILRTRMVQKEGLEFFDPAFLFDEGSTISWVPCGRKLTCSFPGIKFAYGPDTYYDNEVSVIEMDGQFDNLQELIYVESHLSNIGTKFYGELTQNILKQADSPGSNNGTGFLQTLVALKLREVYERITNKKVAVKLPEVLKGKDKEAAVAQ